MAANKEEQFKAWMQERLASAPRVTRIELQHTHTDAPPAVVQTWEITARGKGDSDKLVKQVWEAGDNHASAFGKMQVYTIVAFAMSGKTERACAEFPLRLRGTATDASLAETEPANATGLVSASMRHTEAAMRTMNEMAVTLIEMARNAVDPLQIENAALRARVTEMENLRLESLRLNEELLSKAEERKTARDKHDRDQARKDRALGQLSQVIPRLLSGGAGGAMSLLTEHLGAPPAPEIPTIDPMVKSLAELAKSLTPEDGRALRERLTPATFGRLVEVLQSLAKEASPEEIREALKALAKTITGDEVDICREVLGTTKYNAMMQILLAFPLNDEAGAPQ